MPNSILKKFGSKVRELRKHQGISQEKLAKIVSLHRTYIGGIERGERNVSLANISKIAVALEVEIKELFEDVNEI